MSATETTARDDELLSLAGRTAIVTGAASGIGRAAALVFATRGAHIVIVDRDGPGAREAVEEIERAGGTGAAHEADLSDGEAIEGCVEALTAEHEVVDVLFNQAGLPGPPGLEYDLESWTSTMMVNLWAPMRLLQGLLPSLRRSPSASVIITASTAGLASVPMLATYSASKAGVVFFVKSAAGALASEGIRVNAMCPGPIDTPALRRDLGDGTLGDESLEAVTSMVPLGRLGTPSDIADAALFLASDASRFLTGVALPVDGGLTA